MNFSDTIKIYGPIQTDAVIGYGIMLEQSPLVSLVYIPKINGIRTIQTDTIKESRIILTEKHVKIMDKYYEKHIQSERIKDIYYRCAWGI